MRIGRIRVNENLIKVEGKRGERAVYRDWYGGYVYSLEVENGVPIFRFEKKHGEDFGEIRFPKPGVVEFNRWK